MKDLRSTNRR